MTSGPSSLGDAVRTWRARVSPDQLGLPHTRARRTPGLRREELAGLAGLSVDYVVRLEQGRSTRPSAQVLGSLARALQLSTAERDHLFLLGGAQPPPPARIPRRIPAGLQRLLARLGDVPAGVFAADWQLISWNTGWVALIGDPAQVPAQQRNLVRSRFPVPGAQGRLSDWSISPENQGATDRAVVADLRRASGRYPDDPDLAALIATTLAGSPRFAQLWDAGEVAGHAEDHKTVHHPVVGPVTVDCDVLVDTDTDVKIVLYTVAPGSVDESKLAALLATGDASPAAPPAADDRSSRLRPTDLLTAGRAVPAG